MAHRQIPMAVNVVVSTGVEMVLSVQLTEAFAATAAAVIE
jgi:hypothetical protein